MFWKGKIYLASSGNRTTVSWFLASSLVFYLYEGRRTKNDMREDFFWHMALASVPFFISFYRRTPVYCEEYVHIYRHISDCVETVYELPLLPNDTASEIFLHKSGAVRCVDWIIITGTAAWRCLGEYVILDKTFCNLLFQQEVVAATVTYTCSFLSHSSRWNLLEI